ARLVTRVGLLVILATALVRLATGCLATLVVGSLLTLAAGVGLLLAASTSERRQREAHSAHGALYWSPCSLEVETGWRRRETGEVELTDDDLVVTTGMRFVRRYAR